MKKIKCILTLIILVFSSNIEAQLLWKISKAGNPTSYLFGTHHLVPESTLSKKTHVIEAYNKCQTVIGEVDIEEMKNPMTMAYYMNAMRLPNDTTLKSIINNEAYMALKNTLNELGMHLPEQALNSMRPTALSTMISAGYSAKAIQEKFPGTKSKGIDFYIQEKAKKDNKTVYGLETLKFQTDLLLKKKSIAVSTKELVDVISCIKTVNFKQEATKLVDLYIAEDIDKLLKITEDDSLCAGLKISSEDVDKLINRRNKDWVTKLTTTYLPNKANFIVVGALHLPGEKGLITLLRRQGYTVEAITK